MRKTTQQLLPLNVSEGIRVNGVIISTDKKGSKIHNNRKVEKRLQMAQKEE
jgi:hypothetical protein